MVFQNYALWPHMTVAENVSYGLRIRKIPAAEVGHRLDEGLRKVNLTGLEARYPGQLSGGQQQRVALARALVLEPDILLLDEPLSNLDAKIRVQVRAEIRQLQQALRITTIYVTHDQEEALSLSDRVAVMKDGRVLQVGAPKELYERPRTRFVADFVGTNNLVAGEVLERRDQALIVRTDIGDLRAIPNGAVAGRCVLAIRPENVALGPAEGGGAMDDNVVRGRVAFVSYLGNTLRYDLDTRGGLVLKVDIRDPWHHDPLPIGHEVTATFPASVTLAISDDAGC
jgi:ABC-type Fe3+/spermidine/putrescine transport system ATPase subunit